MKMSDELKSINGDDFDFYRCYKCGRLITAIEVARDRYRDGEACGGCGSTTFQPSNIAWYDWLKPRVLYFAYLRLRGIA